MTVEPASTRANRISSDNLGWSYIKTSLWLGIRRVRGPRQRLRVDVLPDLHQLAVLDSNGEDEIILERLVRGFDLSLGKSDDQNPISLRYIFGGLGIGKRNLLGCLFKRGRHPGAP